MNDKPHQSSTSGHSLGGTITTILITLGVVGAFWLFTNRDVIQTASAAAEPSGTAVAQAWPTVPPTFTPVPTKSAIIVPSATPIPAPSIRQLSELAVIEYTLSSIRTAEGPDGNRLKELFGKDGVTVRAVGRVRVSVPFKKLEVELSMRPDGRAIDVQLPKLVVSGVEILLEQSTIINARQRWVLSDYPGLELQALSLAKNDMYNQVATSPEMIGLATEIARLRVIDHLRELGFTDITVTTSQ